MSNWFSLDQPLQMRKFERDHAFGLQEHAHAGDEVVEVRNLRQHVVADDEVGFPAFGRECAPPSRTPKKSTRVGNALVDRHLRDVGRRLDAEHRARRAAGSAASR